MESVIPPLFAAFTLAHVTASLNAAATVLLLMALVVIKQKKERLHKNLMLTAFGVSCAFLVVYVTRYILEGNRQFPAEAYPSVAPIYYVLLASHLVLAITVPFLAVIAILHGLRDNREAHLRIVKFAFPVWLYVSVTGVVIYLMLYWFYLPPAEQ